MSSPEDRRPPGIAGPAAAPGPAGGRARSASPACRWTPPATCRRSNLSQTGRREFRHLLRSHNLELTALGCPLRRGLDTSPRTSEAAHRARPQGDDAQLRPGPAHRHRPGRDRCRRRPTSLRHAAADRGSADRSASTATASARSWPWRRDWKPARPWPQFLASASTPAASGVNLDPANLLMHGFDPYESARALRGQVVHAHAKDARAGRRQPGGPGSAAGPRRHRLDAATWACWRRSSTTAG